MNKTLLENSNYPKELEENISYGLTDYSNQLLLLVQLRWCAILGQALILLVADKVLNLTIPTSNIIFLILFTTATNIFLQFSGFISNRRYKGLIGIVLIADIIILTGLLYLTGGPSNPFSIVYLVHVCIAGLLLGTWWTQAITVFSTFAFALLFKFHQNIPELAMSHHHDAGEIFSVHLYGMLVSFGLVAVLLGFFLTKMTENIKNQERQISDLKLITANQEKLASLTTLAAGAAHELNTPLSTIALVASELKLVMKNNAYETSAIEDAELILNETKRCKSIIEKLSNDSGELFGEVSSRIKCSELNLILSRELNKTLQSKFNFIYKQDYEIFAPQKALLQALLNLIKNAFEAYEEKELGIVNLSVEVNEDSATFIVEDKGKGIKKENLSKIGTPFFTTKEVGKGMGLGIFLVKLLVNRLQGTFKILSEENIGTKSILKIPQYI